MHPILFTIGPFTVYSYGLMVAVGYGAAVFLAARQAPHVGLAKDRVIDLGFVVLIGGLAGARLLYCLFNLGYFLGHPLEVFYLTRGGLVYYGGLIASILSAFVYCRWKKVPFLDVTDLLAPYVALGQSIGRIGCFLNGCCYGREAAPSMLWAVTFPGDEVARYPTQLYASAMLLVLFIMLRYLQKRRRMPGEVLLAYLVLYSLLRFGIEFLRGDSPAVFLGLTASQVLSLVIFVVSVALYRVRYARWKNTPL